MGVFYHNIWYLGFYTESNVRFVIMKQKNSAIIMKIFSLIVAISLILAACAPGDTLGGAAGADATEPPVQQEPPAQEPPAQEPPAQEPAPTDTPQPTPTQQQAAAAAVVDTATSTPTPTTRSRSSCAC